VGSGRSVATLATRRRREPFHHNELQSCYRDHNELRDPLAAFHRVWLVAEVDERHLQLPSIPGIHQAGTVEHGYTMVPRQTAARCDQTGVAFRNRHGDPDPDQRPVSGDQPGTLGGVKIDATVSRVGVAWQGNRRIEPLHLYLHDTDSDTGGGRTMTKRRKQEASLPGNDGKWFLELVGVEEPVPTTATTLAELASPEPVTVEIVDGAATMGGHGGIVLGQEAGSETLVEASVVPADPGDAPDTLAVKAPRSSSVDSTLDEWQPDELSRSLRSGRRVRWTVLLIALIVGAAVAIAVIQFPRAADQAAQVVADDYRSSMVDLRNQLPSTQQALATLTDPETGEADLSTVVPATAALGALSNTVTQLAGEPLSPTIPLLPWDPMMDLEPTREQMTFIGASGEQIALRLGHGYVYRTTMPLLLETPDLPTEASDSQTINALSVDLASALADSADLVASLPQDPAFDATRDVAIEYVERFQAWTIDYLTALRGVDVGQAESLVDELVQMQIDLAMRTAQSLLLLRAELDQQVIELATDTEAAIAAMPF